MSQNTRGRVAATSGFAVAAVSLGVAFAPAALAAPAPTATVSATTLAPGAEFTITGTGCLPGTDGENGMAVFLPAVDPQWGDATEAGTDGTWTLTETAPSEVGTYEFANFCDSYGAGFDYPNITITVTADGKPATAAPAPAAQVDAVRGAAANTPGIGANRATTAAGDRLAAPGEKVVRVYRGFQPHEVVRVTLHSTPQNVGTFTADAAGVLTVSFTVPAGTAVADDHTLVLVGDKGSYFQESFEIAAAGDARLADTGASVTVPLALGAGLLLAGGGLVFATRRRASGALQA